MELRTMSDSFPSILCADDDPEVLELLKEHFTLQGFIVLTATNGVEACLQVKRWAPRAVVLDLLIPRLGGIGTLSRIRAFNPSMSSSWATRARRSSSSPRPGSP
jgi:CheY-like chemotaxis protein